MNEEYPCVVCGNPGIADYENGTIYCAEHCPRCKLDPVAKIFHARAQIRYSSKFELLSDFDDGED